MVDNHILSDREIEILKLVATGASNKEIAHRLNISPNTVKVHLKNTFSKIGVFSRTEAALFAIRNGLVESGYSAGESGMKGEQLQDFSNVVELTSKRRITELRWVWVTGILLIVLLLFLGLWIFNRSRLIARVSGIPQIPQTETIRWQRKADIPTARFGFAIAVFENHIYAIAGETINHVTGAVERYDTNQNSWESLNEKQTPVADVGAVILGGKIYIPGGRLASGAMTDVLDIYDPRNDQWETGAKLPIKVSGYAITSFEGKLYLFGGWNGEEYLANILEYDPDQDEWLEKSHMPTARGFLGAVVAGGKIYLIGGYDGRYALPSIEVYQPDLDTGDNYDWIMNPPLDTGRYRMGVTSIADKIYILGGLGNSDLLIPIEYSSDDNTLKSFDSLYSGNISDIGFISLNTFLYSIGGKMDGKPIAENHAYQAIYTIAVPLIRK